MCEVELSDEQMFEVVENAIGYKADKVGELITEMGWADVAVQPFFEDKNFLEELVGIIMDKKLDGKVLELIEEYNDDN